MPKLKNPKHELLVQEYLIDLNQTQAAIRAGYSAKSAAQQASELFTKPNIHTRVEELLAERSRRVGVTQDRIVRELARIAFVQATDLIDTDTATIREDSTTDDLAAIQSVKVKTIPLPEGTGTEREIKLADKLKALELLGKHSGMFMDKLELSGKLPIQVVIADDYGDPDSGDNCPLEPDIQSGK